MTTTLNERSYAFAEQQIKNGNVVRDQLDDWSEHQPSAGQENEYIEAHGWDDYETGTSPSMTKCPSRPRPGTSSRTGTSRRCTAAGCSPLKYGPDG